MRRMRAVGLAAVAAAAMTLPLLVAVAPAEALIPKADLKIVKTVGSHGPTINLNSALSDTGLNGHLDWEADGLRISTEKDLDSCVPVPPAYVGPPCPDFFEVPEMRVKEYFDTLTPLSEVVPTQATPPTSWPEPQLYFLPNQQNATVLLQPRLLVDFFNGDGVPDIELVRDLGGPGPVAGANWSGFVPHATDANGNPVPYGQAIGNIINNQAPLSAWLTAMSQLPFPWATAPMVTGFGFGMPRGIPFTMDLTLRAIYFAGTYYDLRRSFQPSIGAAPGETVTYQVKLTNGSGVNTKAAAGVKVIDVLPPDMTYVPDSLVDDVALPLTNISDPFPPPPVPGTSANCEFTGQILTCAPGTLPVGATRIIRFDATLDDTISTAGLPQSEGHWVDVQHRDTSGSIPVGQTWTSTASCPDDYLATDGGLLLDQAGASADIVIESSRATTSSGVSGWTVRATNLGDVRAPVSTEVTCLADEVGSSGGHTHAVDAQALPLQQKIPPAMPATDARPVQRTCPTGYTPYAPQFETTSGIAVVRESYAIDNTWYWFVDHTDGTDASFGISCLAPRTLSASGHTAQLVISVPDDTISIGSEAQTEGIMACPGDSNAIVGGYGGYTSRVRSLGAEPRGDRYMFRFYNEEDTAQNADIQVTCVGALTANEPTYKDVINTAFVTTTTKDRDASDNTSSANVAVSGDPAPSQPSGVILNQLSATRTVVNNKTTALTLDMRCTKTNQCNFTVKAFSGGTLVASKTTSILALTTKNVVVPTTNVGKSLAFGDNVVVKIKTTAGTTQYAVGIVS